MLNFAAGPAKIPSSVLEEVKDELLDYRGTGISIMEHSHRGPEFTEIIQNVKENFKQLLNIPETHEVLLLQGGASTGFAAIPLNFAKGKDSVVDYVVTGTWSSGAAKEASKFCTVNQIKAYEGSYTNIKDEFEWNSSPDAEYVYYCDNETVNGVEFPFVPQTDRPLICDMSSNFMSRPVDVSKYACIYGGAQKNLGPAGVTIYIVKKDLLGKQRSETPKMLSFEAMMKGNSLINTPPVFSIYVLGKVLEWVKVQGGALKMQEEAKKKSESLYNFIDNSNGFYRCHVDAKARSRMNVVFRIKDDEELEKKFIQESLLKGFMYLKGHRSVGGIRASLYNAVSYNDTEKLQEFMTEFMASNKYPVYEIIQ